MDKSSVPVNHNGAEEIEIKDDSVGIVEKQLEDLKLNHQFNEKDVPPIYKTLMKNHFARIEEIDLCLSGSICCLRFDEFEIYFSNKTGKWTVRYEQANETIETDDPEKSIIDHLWFLLKRPNIKVDVIGIAACKGSKAGNLQEINLKKIEAFLQSMFSSFKHQIQANTLIYKELSEDTFFSLLKHVKPGTLSYITFNISWKNEEGNHQKMKEIVETDQWKQAKRISSSGITPLKIKNLLHCKEFWLKLDNITPEDVLHVVEHAFNSSPPKFCSLSCDHEKYDIDAIIDFLRSQNDGSKITKIKPTDPEFKFGYKIVKSGKLVCLFGNESCIDIQNYY